RATYITSVEWHTNMDALVSTYGRGLWRLTGRIYIPDIPRYCLIENCLIRYIDRGDPPPDYGWGILVFDGTILGARAENGALREIFVTPGTALGYTGKEGVVPNIKVTETPKPVGFVGLPRIGFAPSDNPDLSPEFQAGTPSEGGKPALRANIVGFALDAKGVIVGAAYSTKPLPLTSVLPAQAEPKSVAEQGDNRSPTAGKPYVTLKVRSGRTDQVEPGERIVVQISRLQPGATLEVLLDGNVAAKAQADRSGNAAASVT